MYLAWMMLIAMAPVLALLGYMARQEFVERKDEPDVREAPKDVVHWTK